MGEAVVAEPIENGDCINLNELIKLNDSSNNKGVNLSNKVSSITLYLKPIGEIIGDGVRFWGDKNYTNEKDEVVYPPEDALYPYLGKKYAEPWAFADFGGADNKITSMEVDGHYVAILFEKKNYEGNCEVFMGSDPDFRNNRIGQCGWLGRSDCLSSFIIKARK